jgi:2-dehydro-3-deoxygalactonokinase
MVNVTPDSNFISCDWGTSHFRLRLIDRARMTIVAEHASNQGIQALALAHPQSEARRTAMAVVLRTGIAALGVTDQSRIPVVISGMASSTLGWQALPYATLPAPLDGSTLEYLDFELDGRPVRLISGLQSTADVMRGEEIELVGLFAGPDMAAAADSVVILPGTHSKHVQIRAGAIVDFTTYLTGELFQLLSTGSTLRATGETEFDVASFQEGVAASQSLGMSAALFRTRSRPLLGQLASAHSLAYLSGVLIGAEFSRLKSEPPARIVLAAGAHLTEPYRLALATLLPDVTLITIAPTEVAAASIRGHAAMLRHS